ncbi:hypothetical protein SprV_0301367600 [Sparganum proliferum]
MGPHLLKLLLQLAGSEYHVGCPAMTAEAALAFRQDTLFQMVVETVEEYASEDHTGDVEEDASAVVAMLTVLFPPVEADYYGSLEVLGEFSLTPHLMEGIHQMIHKSGAAVLVDFNRDHVRSGTFPLESCCMALTVSWREGGRSRVIPASDMVFEGSVGADGGGEVASPERLAEAHQAIVDALRQTGQSSNFVVSDGKGDPRVPSLCLCVTASEEGVAGTQLFQMALFGETGLIECSDVHVAV